MRGERDREMGKAGDREKRREGETWSGWGGEYLGKEEEECRWGDERGGAAGGQSLMGKLFCWGGGEGGELSEWERKGGMGGGEGGAIFTSYFYTRGESSLCWVGGGGLPFFLETFIFIGIVLLNIDFILRRKLR